MTNSDHQPGPSGPDLAAVSAAPAGIWSIMVRVFTAPTQAFDDFKQKPSFIMPLIVTAVLAAIAAAVLAQYGAMLQYEMLRQSTIIPPQQFEQMRQDALEPDRLIAALSGALPILIIGVLEALFVWFLGTVIFGKPAKYTAVWGVVLLAGLIPQVGALLRIPMAMAKETILVSYGLAALLPGKDFTSILFSFLYFTDVFAVWSVIVAGFGYSALFDLPRAKGMTIAIIAYIIFVAIAIGLTVLGLSFAGVDVSFL